ncbi:beta-N-acetylhexosaminidase [Wenxinia saemankumensis]|uniref:beta-N-acetylhexosaminidase n=1 Tax=Wenxinia saemankumensis TaxID=1447782 RepID=A0A1M6HP14_9RHOB|nr:beta-N-acetylhexosaminidase [Wenxinia saemankumensis]SHJ23898.1 hexosaminidase [Wenxinia saemankumensis]
MTLRLEQSWSPDGARHGAFTFRLVNTGTTDVIPTLFAYASMTRVARDAVVEGGRLIRTFANHVEIAPEGAIPAGGAATIRVIGLTHPPRNRSQGAMAAWIEADGEAIPLDTGDLVPPEGVERGPVRDWPEGRIDTPLLIQPWPAELAVESFGPAPTLVAEGSGLAESFAVVAALHRRLFPVAPAPLALAGEGRRVTAESDGTLPPGGYRLDFGATIRLTHADADGLRHGVLTLAQMAHGARSEDAFAFPQAGHIADAPRFGWRGMHFDVARNFHGPATIARMIDVLAWLKMNRFHWHLTDDEGWRLPSRSFQGLADLAGRRGRDGALPPQYADGPEGQSGSYTEEELRGIVAHAATLGIEVMPELDMPGHVTALLAAIPGLADPEEEPDSYRSIQGYPNNALNPALPRTYEVVGTLLREAAEIFPGGTIHIGSDEVDAKSWTRSPAAQKLAQEEGLAGTPELQARFLRRVQAMLREMGRDLGAWDEAAEGGGVDPAGTLLFAWRSREKVAELIAHGYDVVACPGQAYYLDMAEGAGWDAAGLTWAGAVPARQTYEYEPTGGLPDGPGRLAGVQACLWSEMVDSIPRANAMIFPRLAAVAESGWTPPEAKDFDRFAALSRRTPRL